MLCMVWGFFREFSNLAWLELYVIYREVIDDVLGGGGITL